jgi:hypothetical protein
MRNGSAKADPCVNRAESEGLKSNYTCTSTALAG